LVILLLELFCLHTQFPLWQPPLYPLTVHWASAVHATQFLLLQYLVVPEQTLPQLPQLFWSEVRSAQ
jgi:hypothetical protein